jgi:hypothetical protein
LTATPAVVRGGQEEGLLARARAAAGERHAQAFAAIAVARVIPDELHPLDSRSPVGF